MTFKLCWRKGIISGVHLEHCQTYMMEHFCKNDKRFSQKRYIIGVLQGSKFATRRMNKSVIILATSVNFPTQREHISQLVLVFLLLTLNR